MRLSSQQVVALKRYADHDGTLLLRDSGVSGRTIGSLQRLGLIEGVPPLGNRITDTGRACLALEEGNPEAIKAIHKRLTAPYRETLRGI